MTIGTYELPIWARRGWLLPMNNLPKNYASDDLLHSVRKSLSHQGQLYALPFYAESAMTYYRKDLFAKAGLSENMAFVSMLVQAHKGRWFDDKGRPEIASPLWQSAVGLYLELLGKYGPPNPERNGFNENLALFSEGHCAIWIDATVAAGLLFDSKRSKVASHLAFAPAPVETPSRVPTAPTMRATSRCSMSASPNSRPLATIPALK